VGLVAVIGYWKVTVPDPSGLGETGGLNARKLLRFFQIGGYAVNPLYQGLAQLVPVAIWPASAVGGLLGVVGAFAGFAYARRLAQRIPNDKLARSCRIVMWGMGGVTILGTAFAITSVFFFARAAAWGPVPVTTAPTTLGAVGYVSSGSPPPPVSIGPGRRRSIQTATGTSMLAATMPPPAAIAFGVFSCVMVPLGLVFGIWSIVIVIKLRKALNEASRQALASWASGQFRP